MKRLLTALLFTCIIGISYHADAALVNVAGENYFTDDTTGLDWLNLTVTKNMQRHDALTTNQGWRYATNGEVVDISRKTFGSYYGATSPNGSSTERGTGILFGELNKFAGWFGGLLGGRDPLNDRVSSAGLFGLYVDERNMLTLFGGYRWSDSYGGGTKVTGLNYTGPFYSQYLQVGTFLVRETPSAVPIPAAIWLFGTGLIALLGFARRKV